MTENDPDAGVWHLRRGDEIVGEIHDTYFYDMFWTGGRFHPLGSFEQDLRGVFEDAQEALRTGDHERFGRAYSNLRQTVTLTDPQGAAVPLLNLIIEDDRARFRLGS